MKKEDFISLSTFEQCSALLQISSKALVVIEKNKNIYHILNTAIEKASQFVNDNQSILASELSIFFNNPNENEDFAFLFYKANNKLEEQAIDIITLTIGFVAHIAHKVQDSEDKMPEPVVEASPEIVYEAFNIYKQISSSLEY